jgi:hypothetical protein
VSVSDVISRLEEAKANIRCSELVSLLEGLGFVVKARKKQGHKTVTHPKIPTAMSNFTCGHGKNPTVLPVYPIKIRRMLEEHSDQLEKLGDTP